MESFFGMLCSVFPNEGISSRFFKLSSANEIYSLFIKFWCVAFLSITVLNQVFFPIIKPSSLCNVPVGKGSWKFSEGSLIKIKECTSRGTSTKRQPHNKNGYFLCVII